MAKCGYVTLNVHLRDYFGGECGRGIWETICFFWHCQRNCVETIWLYFVILCSTFDVCTQRGLYDFWQWISTHIYSYSPLLSKPPPTHTHSVLLFRIIILFVDEFIVASFSCSVKCIRVWMAKGIAILCWVVLVGYLLFSTNERVEGEKRLSECTTDAMNGWMNEWMNE